jgi:hypothetical protein
MSQARDIRPWVIDARRIQSEVNALPHGKVEHGLQQIASRVNLNTQTVRRIVAALDFLDRLKLQHKQLASNLQSYPVAAVEYLARWHKRDQRAALKAAENLVTGEITVKQLGDAEKEARKGAFSGSGKSLEVDYRRSVKASIERLVQSSFGGDLTLIPTRRSVEEPSSIPDFAFEDRHGTLVAAVLIVGPYSDKTIYGRRAFDWTAKATALLHVFRYVFLVVPGDADVDVFWRWHTRLKLDERRLRIHHIRS